ncbi:hypothetical protein [Tsukamurella hominis]|uniref:hypothetical protein n=1 Tax=Tsukamurella hominis TaxID=1970232 RepID=UPI0039E7BCCC
MDAFTRRRLAREIDEELHGKVPGAGLETLEMLEQLGFDLSPVSSIAELHALVEEPLQASLGRLRGWPGAHAMRKQLERTGTASLRAKVGVINFDDVVRSAQHDDSE